MNHCLHPETSCVDVPVRRQAHRSQASRRVCSVLLMLPTLLLLASAALGAADWDQAQRDLASDDFPVRRRGLEVIASERDLDKALPALVGLVGDRQLGELAIQALRRRTGLSPAQGRGRNPGYPGYPTEDSSGAWSAWLRARNQAAADKAAQERLTELEAQMDAAEAAKAAEADAAADDKQATDDEAAQPEDAPGAAPRAEQRALGKLDRIFFRDGSILLAHVVTRRTDLDGNLTSVRIVHRDGGGEENIDAALIVRIEEGVR